MPPVGSAAVRLELNASLVRMRLVDGDGKTVGFPYTSKVIEEGGPDPHWNEQFTFEGLDMPCSRAMPLYLLGSLGGGPRGGNQVTPCHVPGPPPKV